jgi:DNA-binding NarL/FixJ family response regulator
MTAPRIILADDHTVLVEAFQKMLEPYCEVVGTVSDGRALLEKATRLHPDVILVDISMPLLNGLEAAARLKQQMPLTKLIFLTMNEDPELALEAMRCGASGYLLKTSAGAELIHAIQVAMKGRVYVTPRILRSLEKLLVDDQRSKPTATSLSPRQREVVVLLAEGKSMKEIATVLNVTPRTIAFHKYRIMQQLNLKTTAELIHFAIKSRIFVP